MTTATPTPTTAAPAPAREDRGPRYPLGVIRALAALSVLTFHAYQLNRTGPTSAWPWDGLPHQLMLGTDAFVDLFFVLSALVLWLPVARAAVDGRTGRPGWVVLVRRMARLLPLYVVVVLLVWAVTNPSLPGHWGDLLLHLTFTHVYSDTYIFWTNGPAWTLAVEFHFYLLVAALVPLLHRLTAGVADRRRRTALVAAPGVALVLAGLAYLAVVVLVVQPEPTNWSITFSPLSRAADFGLGMLLAVLAASGVRLPRPGRWAAATTGLLALAVLAVQRPHDLSGLWWHPAYAAAIAVALAAVVLHDGPWPRVLTLPSMTWLGGLGYGIYLIHEPAMRLLGHLGVLPDPAPGGVFLVTAVLVAVPTVALAWLSSRTVEAGGLRLLRSIDGRGRRVEYYPDGAHRPAAGAR
ncbi:acyltransferase [uncultured Nocardioides sp.]|uniref:acyltransferase family protein n=1 Tax=uncultured Nocardioides sp. TaxID=198441 RepID=UPI002622B652|nr:acyltransferase [uncultured Nocardioides sp.]